MRLAPLPDWQSVGARVALARRTLGLTQAELAARVQLGRSVLAKVESGARQLSALELTALARATGLPIDWFVAESPPAVTSHRTGSYGASTIVDVRVDVLVRDVTQLIEMGLLRTDAERPDLRVPRDVEGAEVAALAVRTHLEADAERPIDLAAAAERLGVFAYSLALPQSDVDGGYVALDGQLGVALINGAQPSARRRYTLAHEIGHHVFQDEYAVDVAATGRSETERIIDAFAIHLLLPRVTLTDRWRELDGDDEPRTAALTIGAEYRVSWTALCAQLINLGIVDRFQGESIRETTPVGGEYAELGIDIAEELNAPSVPRGVARAVISGYRSHRLGPGRTLELLHGTLDEADLPGRHVVPRDAIAGELRSL